MRKINEIFLSIQGEGCHAGVPSVFIRFAGCNLKCGFCDTQHHLATEMTDAEILEVVSGFRAQQIVLTGGEPALFIDEDFIRLLKTTCIPIAIETNGTKILPPGIDWVTVSPKIGMSDSGDTTILVDHANELKVVYVGQDLEQYFNLKCVAEDTVMLLQPCFIEDPVLYNKNIAITVQTVLADPRWRLSLQTHRFIGIP